jgi:FtsH-binding integral membrane protein
VGCAQPWFGFTAAGGSWLVATTVLTIVGAVNVFYADKILISIYAAVMASFFCGFMIYDIQAVLGTKTRTVASWGFV